MENFKGTEGKWFVDNQPDGTKILCRRFPAGIDSICFVKQQFKSQRPANRSRSGNVGDVADVVYGYGRTRQGIR